MDPVLKVMLSIAYGLAAAFPFWPIGLLAALPTRPILRYMTMVWGLFLVCWLLARGGYAPPLFTIIPEPYSTYLFFLAGIMLIMLLVMRWGGPGE